MTDKQIIIDGVDIKNCKRRIGKDNYCRYYKRLCSENNYNCIWKKYLRKEQEVQQAMDNYVQLDLQRVKEYNELVDLYKAKEQECEELKEKVKKYGEINEQETKDYAELKAENEELKKIINEAKSSSLDLQSFLVGEAVQNEYEQQLDQLKKTNEELKNIIKSLQNK